MDLVLSIPPSRKSSKRCAREEEEGEGRKRKKKNPLAFKQMKGGSSPPSPSLVSFLAIYNNDGMESRPYLTSS